MNWSKNRSLRLSRACIWIFAAALIAACICAPWLISLLTRQSGLNLAAMQPYFLASIYLCALPAAAALWDLWRLLRNICAAQIFIAKNTAILRRLSWYCIAVGLVCLASCLYFLPLLPVSAAAAFIGLILRVVKNVFAEAVQLKTENDYTI